MFNRMNYFFQSINDAFKSNPKFIVTSTVIGGISGLCYGINLAINNTTNYSEQTNELIRLALETVANRYNCNLISLPSNLDYNIDNSRYCRCKYIGGELEIDNDYEEKESIDYECQNLVDVSRARDEARKEINHIEYEDDINDLKNAGLGIFYGLTGVVLGGLYGFATSTMLVNLKLKLSAQEINTENVLDALSATNHGGTRKQIIKELRKKNSSVNRYSLLQKADKLFQLRNEYKLNYRQAEAWLLSELHVWFLQGIQLNNRYGLPLEVFLLISSFVANCSDNDTHNLFAIHQNIMPKKLFEVSIVKCTQKFFNSQQQISASLTQYKKEQNEASNRYKKRTGIEEKKEPIRVRRIKFKRS